MEKILLENISKEMNVKKLTGKSRHDFIKGKLCLNNLMIFYNGMISLLDEW